MLSHVPLRINLVWAHGCDGDFTNHTIGLTECNNHFLSCTALRKTRSNRSGSFKITQIHQSTIYACLWPTMANYRDVRVLVSIALYKVAFTFFAANYHFKMWSRANMACYLEKHDVIVFVIALAVCLPEVCQFI